MVAGDGREKQGEQGMDVLWLGREGRGTRALCFHGTSIIAKSNGWQTLGLVKFLLIFQHNS